MRTELGAEVGVLTNTEKSRGADNDRCQEEKGEVEAGDQGEGLDSGLSGLKDEGQGKVFQQREQHVQGLREGGSKSKA